MHLGLVIIRRQLYYILSIAASIGLPFRCSSLLPLPRGISETINMTCSITFCTPYIPVRTPCGHLFEAYAIFKWLSSSGKCPVCRATVDPEFVRSAREIEPNTEPMIPTAPALPSHFLMPEPDRYARIVDSIRTRRVLSLLARQDDSAINQLTQLFADYHVGDTFVAHGDDVVLLAGNQNSPPPYPGPRATYDPIPMLIPDNDTVGPMPAPPALLSMRFVDLSNEWLNPRSSQFTILHDTVFYSNRRFRDSHPGPQPLRKYTFHSRRDLAATARTLARYNILVYDLFELRRDVYVVYTIETDLHHDPHGLRPFRR